MQIYTLFVSCLLAPYLRRFHDESLDAVIGRSIVSLVLSHVLSPDAYGPFAGLCECLSARDLFVDVVAIVNHE